MKLYIPKLGEEVKLKKDWTFELYEENRNIGFVEELCSGLVGQSIVLHQQAGQARDAFENVLRKKHGVTPDDLRAWMLGRSGPVYAYVAGSKGRVCPQNIKDYLLEAQEYEKAHPYYPLASQTFVLPKGTVLKFDRYYIRQGAEDFDSVTFKVVSCPLTKKKLRFWAKLNDVNQMEIV